MYSKIILLKESGQSQGYASVQGALDASSGLDLVLVYPGSYAENVIVGSGKRLVEFGEASYTSIIVSPGGSRNQLTKNGLVLDAVRVAITTALPANTYNNGVITANANGAIPTQDGISLDVGDRILLAVDTDLKSGPYEVSQVGDGAQPFVLTRTADANTSAKMVGGIIVPVNAGAIYAGSIFMLTTAGTIVLGTTPLTFSLPNTQGFGRNSRYTELFDDFDTGNTSTGTVGRLKWWFTGTGGTPTIAYDTYGAIAGRPGILRFSVAGPGAVMYLLPGGSSGATVGYIGNTPNMRYKLALANVAGTRVLRFGMTQTINGTPAYGIFFKCTNAGNWFAESVTADGTESTDTGIAQSTSFKSFEFVVSPDGLSIKFFIDSVLVATHTLRIPTTGLKHEIYCSNTGSMDIDLFDFSIPGLNR
jgi:hypothetical protein